MSGQLQRVGSEFGVPVYSTGGFSSVTVTYEIAQRIERYDEPTVFLHVGDFDPSGESIFQSMTEDVAGFLGFMSAAHFIPERVALTREQVEQYDLPTAPPKRTDSRSRNWDGETTQAEAMPPDLLASTIRTALEGWTDLDRVEEVKARALDEREQIEDRLREIDFLGDE